MTDEERDRIRREAREETREDAAMENRVFNMEKRLERMEAHLAWFVRAVWGFVVYLGVKVGDFLLGGWHIK